MSAEALSATADVPQEAVPHEEVPHEAVPHEAVPQEAVLQDAVPQEAADQAAVPHEEVPHDAVPQEASRRAVVPQLEASKTRVEPPDGSGTRKRSIAAFGFGGARTSTAFAAFTSPTPSDIGAADGVGRAVSMSAPFTWSGVHVGCTARR